MSQAFAARGCAEFRRASGLTRREILRVGGLWGSTLALSDLLCAQATATDAGTFGRAKSIIMLYLHGGHAQQETYDPKPDGPSPARGEFQAISTSVAGVQFSELLPRTAAIAHKLAVIRSMSHPNANHVQAALPAMTGHAHPIEAEARGDFPPSLTDFPAIGAVLDRVRPSDQLPTWVQVGPQMRRNNGTVLHGQSSGFLGLRHNSLVVDQDLIPANVRVGAVTPNPDLNSLRITSRRKLLEELDDERRRLDRTADVQSLDDFQQRALNLLTSTALASAFDLAAEPATVRDAYGRTQFGQCCVLARRLAEAGVPMINVHFCHTPVGSWDTHGQHFKQMKATLCPTLDQSFSALVNDLDDRGLLDQTLVIVNAEFGRTPKVNGSSGRDHWPWVYSLALSGGGVARGVVYGSSDKIAAYPTSHPHDPKDMAATIYHLLGIDPDLKVYDNDRPVAIAHGGQPITEILA